MYHRYRARLYGLLPIPRSACILSNPQECAVGTHGILAILTISSSTSSSDRPGESSTRLYTNHPSRSPSTFTRSTRFSRSIAQVHLDSLACTCLSFYPQIRRDLQIIPRRTGEGLLTLTRTRTNTAFNSCNSLPVMAFSTLKT